MVKKEVKSNNYDVIIVGAGPTGLMLARQLNNSKLKILLVEKNKNIKSTRAGIYGCFRDTPDKLGLAKYIKSKQKGFQVNGYKKSVYFPFKK